MNQSQNEALDAELDGLPMPLPLGDPLMFLARFHKWAIPIFICLFLVVLVVSFRTNDIEGASLAVETLQLIAIMILTFSLGLPKRAVNALYLRSFSKDSETDLIREHLDVVLGSDYRLSGIRDPRKRINYFFRPVLILVMVVKYAGARYLGLEASSDWKARIWASLRETRLVFLDLTEVTEYVKEEVHLCLSTMPLQNLIFIVDGPVDEVEWKEQFCAEYGLGEDMKQYLRLAIWQRQAESNDDFVAKVASYISLADQAPEARLMESYELIATSISTEAQIKSERSSNRWRLFVGTFLPLLALILAEEIFFLSEFVEITLLIGFGGFYLYLLFQLIVGIFLKHRKLNLARRYRPGESKSYLAGLVATYLLVVMLAGAAGLVVFDMVYV